jgi:hypothetical protein
MTYKIYNQILKDIKILILKQAKKNDWLWFYELHQKEVNKSAELLLKHYKADRQIVMLATWLHDISKYFIKNKKHTEKYNKTHHIDSYKIAMEILSEYNLEQDEIDRICNSVLRHRNKSPYQVQSIEDKIVAVADKMSHFSSVFYFTYFKFHPDDSIEDMVKQNIKKIKLDWKNINLLPKARSLVKKEYEILLRMHQNYNK